MPKIKKHRFGCRRQGLLAGRIPVCLWSTAAVVAAAVAAAEVSIYAVGSRQLWSELRLGRSKGPGKLGPYCRLNL